jgi:hypothetical protein
MAKLTIDGLRVTAPDGATTREASLTAASDVVHITGSWKEREPIA